MTLDDAIIIKTPEDYLKFIQRTIYKGWKKIDAQFKETFGVPKKYPCIVVTYEYTNPDHEWGGGEEKDFKIMYPKYIK